MSSRKKRVGFIFFLWLILAVSPAATVVPAESAPGADGLASAGAADFPRMPAASGRQEAVFQPLPGPGKKCRISDEIYFTYEFSAKPRMGTVILKIRVFDKGGAQITPFLIKGRSDMPSMRGAHDSGDVEFKLNRKNDYLMPVNIVMPGEWEVRLTFLKDGDPVFFGRINFNV